MNCNADRSRSPSGSVCARVVPRVLALAWSFTVGIPSALAHGAGDPLASSTGLWPWSSDVLIGLTIAAILFWRGSAHKTDKESPVSRGRAVLLYSGLGAVFLALQTPLDAIAGHMFSGHQVQHLLLRGIAPMLVMLSLPSGPLLAGLPTVIRRRLVAPMMRNNGVQSIFGFLTRPMVCTTVYVTSLYFWQLPAIPQCHIDQHDAALCDAHQHAGLRCAHFFGAFSTQLLRHGARRSAIASSCWGHPCFAQTRRCPTATNASDRCN